MVKRLPTTTRYNIENHGVRYSRYGSNLTSNSLNEATVSILPIKPEKIPSEQSDTVVHRRTCGLENK